MLLQLDIRAGVAIIHGVGHCGAAEAARADGDACVPIVDRQHAREVVAHRAPQLLLDVCADCRDSDRLRVLIPNRRFGDD